MIEKEPLLADFSIIEPASIECSRIDNSCIFARIKSDSDNPLPEQFTRPVKLHGVLFVVLAQGTLNINYNSNEYTIKGPSAFSTQNDAILSINASTSDEPLDLYILGLSPSFLQEVNISYTSITSGLFVTRESPEVRFKERELPLILRYLTLIHSVMTDSFNTQLARHGVSHLTSALFYQMLTFLYKDFGTVDSNAVGPRRGGYVHEFMKLVHQYYTSERSVNFYASRLFISPKYLSLMVKETTGHSAAWWIDHFVITEAKNLLRFSGKNIQQVAYALNFSNQSSFGKYFKHLTGMSPTEFQKS